jgi:hypothetical protein
VYSVCKHGPTDTLLTNLNPLLVKYGAHYVAGHDHCSAHLESQSSVYIQQGMGDFCCYQASNLNHTSIPSEATKWYISRENAGRHITAGYSSVKATSTGMSVEYHDQV